MGNNIRSSSRPKALAPSVPMPPLADAMDAVHLSVDRFCLLAGVEALAEMMEEDATTVCGARHRRHGDRRGYRWGRTHSEIGDHGGKVKVARPRVRDRAGKEVSLESWQALRDGNLLLEWALNLMVLNVSTMSGGGCPPPDTPTAAPILLRFQLSASRHPLDVDGTANGLDHRSAGERVGRSIARIMDVKIRVHELATVKHWVVEHAIVDQGTALGEGDDGNE